MTYEHQYPTGYPPLSYCRECGRDFSGDRMFDHHRVGSYEYDWSPSHEDGRRCLDEDEMRDKGWRPMTDEEMQAPRQQNRAGFGVEMWFDPAEVVRGKAALARSRASASRSAT